MYNEQIPSVETPVKTPTEGVDYADLDNIGEETVETPAQAPAPAAPAAPESTPATPPVQPITPPAQAPAQPQTPAGAPPVAPVVTPGQPPVAPIPSAQPVAAPVPPGPSQEEQVRVLLQQRTDLVNTIAGRYTLNEQDKELFLTEPEKVVPNLMGRMYVDVFEGVYQALAAKLPEMMAGFSNQQKAADSREADFYKRWPVLDKPEYKQQVNRLAAMYRQFNPGASFEQLREDLGVQAMVALRIPIDQVVPSAPTPPQAPQAPVPQATGFRPAAPSGAVPITRQGQQPTTIWQELSLMDD